LDITATKKFGNWEIGPVAYLERQSTSDRPGGGASCAQMAAATGSQLTCGHATDFAIGGLVGYDFGRVALKLILTESVYTKDEFGGLPCGRSCHSRYLHPKPQMRKSHSSGRIDVARRLRGLVKFSNFENRRFLGWSRNARTDASMTI